MKLIIAGSRTLEPSVYFLQACICEAGLAGEVTEIISGMALGVDTSAIELTKQRLGLSLLDMKLLGKLKEFPCTKEDWNIYGRGAGHRRNRQMGDYADALLLIWNGESSGSKGMKDYMLKLNKPVYEVILKSHLTNQ